MGCSKPGAIPGKPHYAVGDSQRNLSCYVSFLSLTMYSTQTLRMRTASRSTGGHARCFSTPASVGMRKMAFTKRRTRKTVCALSLGMEPDQNQTTGCSRKEASPTKARLPGNSTRRVRTEHGVGDTPPPSLSATLPATTTGLLQ